jgi:ElaB/YqjD/DUF883 family membrane-anchored ribosome-binding protein
MNGQTKSNARVKTPADLEMISDDLASLKRDLAALMGHVKTGGLRAANEAAHNTIGQLGDRATEIYENLAAQGKKSVKAIGHQVDENPVASILVAFAAGFCVSRLLAR